ncbi:DoxX family protein [Mycobacterium sp. PS03-16]|uniref:DoxX family protein n=1 Tax=Mycobacterium sp. PS03-16 TaxID=2559611 RepID=UPI0010730081|nr:DoxX family protein [Mycobacterium sp. PS03-16]TFV56613.1 DoxX family protein [Mycobacterium sp. PS03-16]
MEITDTPTASKVPSRTLTADVGVLVLRVVFGGLLTAAGLQKLLGWFGGPGLTETGAMFEQIGYRPGVFFAGVAGLLEVVGGLLLLLGLFTPLASAIVIGVMINAASATWSAGLFGLGGYQMALLYGTAGAVIACTGAGVLALDQGRPWQRTGPRWAAASILTGVASAVAVLVLKTLM